MVTHTEALIEIARYEKSILLVAQTGSHIHGKTDAWSDEDILVVVADDSRERFFPALDWLAPLGRIYTLSQSEKEFWATTRLVLYDLTRIDLTIVRQSALAHIDQWPHVPFWQGIQVMFSRKAFVLDELSKANFPEPPFPQVHRDQFDAMTNEFRFKAMLAIVKVARNDRLIALHLALDLLREACVVAMMVRDNQMKTTHHRTGGIGNDFVDQLELIVPSSGPGILDLIAYSINLFEQQALQLLPDMKLDWEPLQTTMTRARAEFGSE